MDFNASKTLKEIDTFLEDTQDAGHRDHLGASVIGMQCGRALWYLFRWAHAEKHSARTLRLFERGNLEEKRFIKWFRGIGLIVWDRDTRGNQIRVSDCDGHFGGSLDGIISGVRDIGLGENCVLEVKTHCDKSFKTLCSKNLEDAKFEHYVQVNIYMGLMNIHYALYSAINKNTDEIYFEIIPFDESCFTRHISRAHDIIYDVSPPLKISDSPGWWICVLCTYKYICHKGKCPEINCRTCLHSSPSSNGTWICDVLSKQSILTTSQQHNGCDSHIIHPHLVPFEQIDFNTENQYIEYLNDKSSTFRQGPGGISSLSCKISNFAVVYG